MGVVVFVVGSDAEVFGEALEERRERRGVFFFVVVVCVATDGGGWVLVRLVGGVVDDNGREIHRKREREKLFFPSYRENMQRLPDSTKRRKREAL